MALNNLWDEMEAEGSLRQIPPENVQAVPTGKSIWDEIEEAEERKRQEDTGILDKVEGVGKALFNGVFGAIEETARNTNNVDESVSDLAAVMGVDEEEANRSKYALKPIGRSPNEIISATANELRIPISPEEKSIVSDFAEPLMQFTAGFLATRGMLGKSVPTFPSTAIASGTSDAVAFDPDEGMLLEFANEFPGIDPYISEGLLVSEDDPDWQNRTKKFIRSAFGGAMADVVFTQIYKHLKRTKAKSGVKPNDGNSNTKPYANSKDSVTDSTGLGDTGGRQSVDKNSVQNETVVKSPLEEIEEQLVTPESVNQMKREMTEVEATTPQGKALKDKILSTDTRRVTDTRLKVEDGPEPNPTEPHPAEGIYIKSVEDTDALVQKLLDGPTNPAVKSNMQDTPTNVTNFDRITDTDDVLNGIQAMGEQLELKSMGIETYKEIIDDTFDMFSAKGAGKILTSAKKVADMADESRRAMLGARVIMQDAMGQVQEILPRIKAGASTEDVIKFNKLVQVAAEASKIAKSLARSKGRDLNSLNIKTSRFDDVDLSDLEGINIEHGNARKLAEEFQDKLKKAETNNKEVANVKDAKKKAVDAKKKADIAQEEYRIADERATQLEAKAQEQLKLCNISKGGQ